MVTQTLHALFLLCAQLCVVTEPQKISSSVFLMRQDKNTFYISLALILH
jgi:hypothetical protein